MNNRIAVAGLSLSAAAFVALLHHEGYTDKAVVPVKGDVPTVGFGSTKRPDGTPVQMGDTITPLQAVGRTMAHLEKDQKGIRDCVTAPLTQTEYDTMVDFSYQYGVKALCSSSIVRLANAGRYEESCQAYSLYRFVAGRDCSVRSNNCFGVWIRQQRRINQCLGG